MKKQRNGTNTETGMGFQPGNLLPRRRSEADKFITQQLIACLHEKRKLEDGTEKERVAIACDALVAKFESGDMEAAAFVIDRVEGKLTEKRQVDGEIRTFNYDLSVLTKDQRAQFAQLAQKAKIIDIVPNETEDA